MRAATAARRVRPHPPATCGARSQVYRSYVASSNSMKFSGCPDERETQWDDEPIQSCRQAHACWSATTHMTARSRVEFYEKVNRAFSPRKYAGHVSPRARPPALSTMGAAARCDGSAVAALRFRGSV